jgi:hypothetical protein
MNNPEWEIPELINAETNGPKTISLERIRPETMRSGTTQPETDYPQRSQSTLSMHDYLEIILNRKWYVIVPLVVAILASSAFASYLPKIQSDHADPFPTSKCSEKYVEPTITDTVINRLTIPGNLSRTRLEKVIQGIQPYFRTFERRFPWKKWSKP